MDATRHPTSFKPVVRFIVFGEALLFEDPVVVAGERVSVEVEDNREAFLRAEVTSSSIARGKLEFEIC